MLLFTRLVHLVSIPYNANVSIPFNANQIMCEECNHELEATAFVSSEASVCM